LGKNKDNSVKVSVEKEKEEKIHSEKKKDRIEQLKAY